MNQPKVYLLHCKTCKKETQDSKFKIGGKYEKNKSDRTIKANS